MKLPPSQEAPPYTTPLAGKPKKGSVRTPRADTNPTPPPLSPAYVKDTIAALTSSRRALGCRLDALDLFHEPAARADDPVEIQLLFACRDDYLAAATPGSKTGAMITMAKLLAQSRAECADVAKEMNRLLVAAMSAETAQKKINAALDIAASRRNRNAGTPTLADLIEKESHAPDAPSPADPDQEPIVILDEDDGAGCADELQAGAGAGGLPPE